MCRGDPGIQQLRIDERGANGRRHGVVICDDDDLVVGVACNAGRCIDRERARRDLEPGLVRFERRSAQPLALAE